MIGAIYGDLMERTMLYFGSGLPRREPSFNRRGEYVSTEKSENNFYFYRTPFSLSVIINLPVGAHC